MMKLTRRSLLRTGATGTTLGVVSAIGLSVPSVQNVLAASNVHEDLANTLIGTWKVTVTFPDGTTETSFVAFEPNENIFLVLSPGPGTGIWGTTGAKSFFYHFTELVNYTPPSDSQSPGTFTVLVVGTQSATLGADGLSYTSSGVAQVFTPDGVLLRTVTTTSVATKVS